MTESKISAMTFVVAHSARLNEAKRLAARADAVLSVDDGSLGEWGHHLMVLGALANEPGITHGIVLQDDALPSQTYLHDVQVAIASRPDSIIGLYWGAGRPYHDAAVAAAKRAIASGASWIEAPELYWGVGTVFPITVLRDFLKETAKVRRDMYYDRRVARFTKARKLTVSYTFPSLVNHADWPTVIRGNAREPLERPRRAVLAGRWRPTEEVVDFRPEAARGGVR